MGTVTVSDWGLSEAEYTHARQTGSVDIIMIGLAAENGACASASRALVSISVPGVVRRQWKQLKVTFPGHHGRRGGQPERFSSLLPLGK